MSKKVSKSDELEPGNIDLEDRPDVPHPKGGRWSVLSGSYNIDGQEVLIPHVSKGPNAKVLTNEEALAQYRRTGKHLGKYRTPEAATARGRFIHAEQTAMGVKGSKKRKRWKAKQAARRAAAKAMHER
jgi:hypothetical protein